MSRGGLVNKDVHRQQLNCLQPRVAQKISFAAVSVQSAAFYNVSENESTTMIRFFPTSDCYIATGDSPTAVSGGNSSSFFCPGGVIQYFGVERGSKIAVIQDTTAGDLHILEGF